MLDDSIWTYWNVLTNGILYRIPLKTDSLNTGDWVAVYQIYWTTATTSICMVRGSRLRISWIVCVSLDSCFANIPYRLV